jgi:hypothetical protein
MCALPLHAWTLVLAFRDLSWVADRTNAWDAVGVLSYGLVFALVESILLFLVAVLLGYLLPASWGPRRRMAVLSVFVLVLSLWAMVGQLFFLLNVRLPGALLQFLAHTGHPLRVLYIAVPSTVTATFLIPLVLVLRTSRGMRFMGGLIERLSLLAMLYLVFDAAAVIIVLIRNLGSMFSQ